MELRDAIDYIGAPAGGVIGWLLGRRKSKAEAIAIEIKSLRDVIDALNDHIERQDKRIHEQGLRINWLEDELQSLRER
jgi:hypothetical protein